MWSCVQPTAICNICINKIVYSPLCSVYTVLLYIWCIPCQSIARKTHMQIDKWSVYSCQTFKTANKMKMKMEFNNDNNKIWLNCWGRRAEGQGGRQAHEMKNSYFLRAAQTSTTSCSNYISNTWPLYAVCDGTLFYTIIVECASTYSPICLTPYAIHHTAIHVCIYSAHCGSGSISVYSSDKENRQAQTKETENFGSCMRQQRWQFL